MTEGRQRVCLSMIVKDEAAVLPRCLESVLPWIDAYAIVDTGSTDGTLGVIHQTLGHLPGQVSVHPHTRSGLDKMLGRNHFDFAKYRNKALRLADQYDCDYLLLIDADEEFVVTNGAPEWATLKHDRYVANFRVCETGDGRVWHRTLLVRSDGEWFYKWPCHESLHHPSDDTTAAILAGVEVRSYSDGARNQDKVAKYLRDAAVLRKAIKDEPDEPRHWFYLGQSLAGAGRFLDAMKAYEKRVELGGWDEERWHALYQLAPLRELLGWDWRDVRDSYLKAWATRPHRAEPLWAAGILSVDNGEAALGELYLREAASLERPPDSFLVDESIYEWRALDDLAGALATLGRKDDCLDVLTELRDRAIPEEHRKRVEENLETAQAA